MADNYLSGKIMTSGNLCTDRPSRCSNCNGGDLANCHKNPSSYTARR